MNQEARSFYKSLVNVVGPIAIQNLIAAAVSSADVIMLDFVGQTAIAASNLAGNFMFIMNMLTIGISSGLVILASQYWGKNDKEAIRILHGTALRISSICGLIFSLATFFMPELLMQIFTREEQLIHSGAQYLRAVSLSYVCFSISQVFQAGFKSIERIKIVTIMSTFALLLNIALNAFFIFVVKMGITGVGIATSIARAIELLFCLIYAATQKDVKFTVANVFKYNKILNKDFMKYSLPAMGNEIVWGAAIFVYSIIIGHMGEDIVAANSIVGVIRQLVSVLGFGMAYGGAVVLGKTIGSGNLELADRNAKRLIKSTIITGIGAAVLFLILYPIMPYIAKLTPTASHYRNVIMLINAASIIGAITNTVFICGVFRAGGDAKFGFYMDCISMWFVSVPLGLLAAYVFKLSPLWVYFILYLDEFEKMPVIIIHYFKKQWLKNITRDNLQTSQ